jgi:hypothetical protein
MLCLSSSFVFGSGFALCRERAARNGIKKGTWFTLIVTR